MSAKPTNPVRRWQRLGPLLPQQHNFVTRFIGRSFFRLTGWRLEGEIPNRDKLIIAVAPHTSNFDFILTVGVMWSLGLRSSYIAKRSLFRFPLGMVMRWFGGIPVDRGAGGGLVEQLSERFRNSKAMVLGITPEGTRSAVKEWKKGFALIAAASNVPVLPAIINNHTRVVHFVEMIEDVSDPEVTLGRVKDAAQRVAVAG